MLTRVEKIADVMTKLPRTIRQEATHGEALGLLGELGVRHLPVVDDVGLLVGVISATDMQFASRTDYFLKVPVRDVMALEPFCVTPDDGVRDVVHLMANRKHDCAVVKGPEGRPVGIFTAVDGLLFLELLLTEMS